MLTQASPGNVTLAFFSLIDNLACQDGPGNLDPVITTSQRPQGSDGQGCYNVEDIFSSCEDGDTPCPSGDWDVLNPWDPDVEYSQAWTAENTIESDNGEPLRYSLAFFESGNCSFDPFIDLSESTPVPGFGSCDGLDGPQCDQAAYNDTASGNWVAYRRIGSFTLSFGEQDVVCEEGSAVRLGHVDSWMLLFVASFAAGFLLV